MLRAILFLLAAVVAISALRSVIGTIARLFAEFTGNAESAGPGSFPRRPAAPVSETLKRDPVCRRLVAPSVSVQKTISGVTYYFCSGACCDKFDPESSNVQAG